MNGPKPKSIIGLYKIKKESINGSLGFSLFSFKLKIKRITPHFFFFFLLLLLFLLLRYKLFFKGKNTYTYISSWLKLLFVVLLAVLVNPFLCFWSNPLLLLICLFMILLTLLVSLLTLGKYIYIYAFLFNFFLVYASMLTNFFLIFFSWINFIATLTQSPR